MDKSTAEIAIRALEAERDKIDQAIAELRGGHIKASNGVPSPFGKKRRTLSMSARKAISEAQKKRWAARKK